jgi:hypothetical protein
MPFDRRRSACDPIVIASLPYSGFMFVSRNW